MRHVRQLIGGLFALALAAAPPSARAADGEIVHFSSRDGETAGGKATQLDGHLFRPAATGRRPALVLLHGCGGLLDRHGAVEARLSDWAARLSEHGYVALLVDSFTPRGQRSECGGISRVSPSSERPRDAYGALLYLQAQDFVRADRIGLMGWSHGGASVLYTIAAADKARPAALPGGDFRAAVAFYPGSCNAQAQAGDWTSRVPLLVLNGRKDNWTPAGDCRRFLDAAVARGAPASMQIYDGAYHDFDWPDAPLHEVVMGRKANGVAPLAGTDPAARADALVRVPAFLDKYLQD